MLCVFGHFRTDEFGRGACWRECCSPHTIRIYECIILNLHSYETTVVEGSIVKPVETKMQFRTERQVPKLGVMLVGLGGNNGWYVTMVTSYSQYAGGMLALCC